MESFGCPPWSTIGMMRRMIFSGMAHPMRASGPGVQWIERAACIFPEPIRGSLRGCDGRRNETASETDIKNTGKPLYQQCANRILEKDAYTSLMDLHQLNELNSI